MSEETVRGLLEEFWTSVLSQLGLYFVLFGVAIIVFWYSSIFINRRRVRMPPPKIHDVSADALIRPDGPFAIAAPVIPAASRPDDGHYFDRVMAFATKKAQEGQPLFPIERLMTGALGFLHAVLKSGKFGHLDDHRPTLPYKSWELRQVLEQIGLVSFVDLFERAIAVHQHRMQLFEDMTDTGMPKAQALAHPDMPQYDPLDAQLVELGGLDAFVAAADTYISKEYPWAEG